MSTTNGSLLAQAQKAINRGRKEHARQLLHQAARQDPTDHRPWLYLAGLTPSPVASRAFLDRAASLKPGDPTIDRARDWVEDRLQASSSSDSPPSTIPFPGGPVPEVQRPGDRLGVYPGSGATGTSDPAVDRARAWVEQRLEQAALQAPHESQPARIPWRDVGWTLAGSLLLLVLIAFAGSFAFLWPLRLPLGLAFVLFVPGYWLIAALFPRAGDLDGIERLALSIGLSVAVIAPLALILDWLPWGIRLWPIVAAYGLYYAILVPIAIYRRRRLPSEERFVPHLELDLKGWWAAQDRVNRIIYFVLLGAFLLASFSAAAILLLPKPGEQFTEFYMLGPEGLAENFPRQAAPGEVLTVTLGVTNRERDERTYHVEVWAIDPFNPSLSREGTDRDRQLVAESPPLTLPQGETLEWPLTWFMPLVGDDQQALFLLYIDGQPDPYRQLRLWLDVVD